MMNQVARNLSLLLAVGLSGCVLTHPTDPYRPIAGRGAFSRAGVAVGRSATTRPAGGALGLSEAIEVALANNPEVAAIGWEQRAVRARRDVATGAILPSVHAAGGYTRYMDDQRPLAPRGNGELGVFSRNILGGELVVSMPLYTGGRLISEIKAAELLRQAAAHRWARSRKELVFNVSSVFYGILAQRRVIESTEFSRKALQEHLKRVRDLIAASKAAKVDRLRTEVRLADLRQRLVREKNVLDIQHRVLANLLGVGASEQPIIARGELQAAQSPLPAVEASLADAYGLREDYLAARAALEAQAKAVDAARAGHLPTVLLAGSYGLRWAADASEHPSGVSSSDDVGQVGVLVDVPIFEGGRIEARVREQRARLAAARERLRQLRLQVRLDVETATLNIRSAAQRVEATEKATEQATESLRIEREKYGLGKGSITDVLDAQSALLDSQTNYYRALADYSTAVAQLRLAVGGPMK